MNFKEILSRKRGRTEPSVDGDVSPVGPSMLENNSARRQQRLLLSGVAGAALIGASYWIFSGDTKPKGLASVDGKDIKVATGDMVNRNQS